MMAQGGKYQPFISGEVNRAIANSLAAQKPLLDILKLFQGNTTIMPIAPSNGESINPGLPQNEAYLTIDGAHKLLQSPTPVLRTDGTYLEAILLEQGDMPETNPNLQGGDILRGQSLSIGAAENAPEAPKRLTREERRKASMGITEVLEDDEFVA